MATESEFEKELASAVNKSSMENGSNTPDFILATFLKSCLFAFNAASRSREKWYGKELHIDGDAPAAPPSEKALQIAARVWCDQDMTKIVMDADAAERIALIVDSVLASQIQ